ncbi:MAG TPA: hypothetical protein VFN21_07075 [Acidimicrobiales bacterium]|nr:hypothetical protein [Acidimicrobiales bacterium]
MMAEVEGRDRHEWVSFEDPDEERTWVFDLTFLTSNWTCIFGRGCQGVLTDDATDLQQGCCSYGAHFNDDAERARVERAAEQLDDDLWQFAAVARRRGGPTKTLPDDGAMTRLVDDACIFLNRPGFGTGPGCAFHFAAQRHGTSYLDLKPEVCWQVPLRREDVVADDGHVTSTVREWKRRDWGEGGADFHWWCTDAPDAFVGDDPAYASLREELIDLTSPSAYAFLVDHITERRRRAASSPVFLAHPAIRRARRTPG